MIVKICGITNPEDAALAVDAGATALGFNFYQPSPRYISPETARSIVETVPPGIVKVGIFVNELPATVTATLAASGLDVAQIIGEPVRDIRFWRVYRMDESFSEDALNDPDTEAFLLDAPSGLLFGGTGQTIDWRRARIPGKRIVLAGGLGPDNVAAAISECQPWGVDACSRLESSPGRKDAHKVRAFVLAALNS
jgi:phosphoribosylanthranilate isomerase